MQTFTVRDNQVVLILAPSEARELRKRIKSPEGGAWSNAIRKVDALLEQELYHVEKGRQET